MMEKKGWEGHTENSQRKDITIGFKELSSYEGKVGVLAPRKQFLKNITI